MGNTERGAIAEYLVAVACNVDHHIRIGWDSYDLTLNNDRKVEVKSSGYIQTWKQKKLSTPIFGIQKTRTWDPIENSYNDIQKRQAEVYVFALLVHLDKETINPLDTNQWEFYVLSTSILDKFLNNSKQVTLKRLINIGAIKCSFEKLHKTILNINI